MGNYYVESESNEKAVLYHSLIYWYINKLWEKKIHMKKYDHWLGAVTHARNPSTLGG